MPICPDCKGRKTVTCPVCKGSRKDVRNSSKECGYCNGKGEVKCDFCSGKGEVSTSDMMDRPR